MPSALQLPGLTSPALETGFLTRALSLLVAARSDNPGRYEGEAAAVVEHLLREHTACEVTRVETLPGRPSLAAVLPGRDPQGPRLVINGHLDTVPVDDESVWSVAPFEPTLRGDLLYGRGACDMKGGLAAQIAVAAALSPVRDHLQGTLVLHFAAGEERAEPGTASLLEAGFGGDVGVVTEPTGLRVATAARGLAYYAIVVRGRSVHSSRPQDGANPLLGLPAVLDAVRRYGDDVRRRAHDLLPPGSSTPTMVHGGRTENMVPDTVCLTVDRRLLPGEDVEAERARLEGALAAVPLPAGLALEVRTHQVRFDAAEAPGAELQAAALRRCVGAVTGHESEPWGTPYSSDVRVLVNEGGMPAMTFGPGDISLAHAPDEHVPVSQVRAAAAALTLFARELLGVRPPAPAYSSRRLPR